MGQIGRYEGSDAEQSAKANVASTTKEQATEALNLLKQQYDRIASPDSIAMKGLNLQQQSDRMAFEDQSRKMAAAFGRTGLAGSGTQDRARRDLANQFRSRQAFTREKAIDDKQAQLDRLSAEMQNIIFSTRSTLAGLTGDLGGESRDFNPPGLAEYGIKG